MPKALITGINGQDGSYLAELLLEKGYEVHGIVRKTAMEDPIYKLSRINHILDKITLHTGSLDSYSSIYEIINKVKPNECYHLGAQSFVKTSFEDEFTTMNVNINGTHHILSAIKNIVPHCKFYFAASSEMFGKVEETPQSEKTKFHPRSIYGITKCTGYELTRYYRESYNIFACSGILFNHESERRGIEFVTRKISDGVAKIYLGMEKELILGNIYAKRDWGHAKDYVEAMYLMLQQNNPEDYVIATGETHSIREFLEIAFNYVGLDWRNFVKQDIKYMRPSEVDVLCGDYSKARNILKWNPRIKFNQLVKIMLDHDIERLKNSKQYLYYYNT